MDHPGTEDKREQPYRKNLISRKRLERKKEMKLGGIVPALVTPYDGEGKVNYEMLKKLVEVLLEDGADGFYVTGSTGNFSSAAFGLSRLASGWYFLLNLLYAFFISSSEAPLCTPRISYGSDILFFLFFFSFLSYLFVSIPYSGI